MPTARHTDDPGATDLRRDLNDAQERLRATGEVLQALGRSGSDLDDVFRTVVRSAQRLCRGDAAQLHLYERGAYRLAWHSGLTDEYRAFMAEHPIVADRATLVGRVGLDRRTQQIDDVLADPEYRRTDAQRLGRFRTIIGAPMLLGGEVVGVLSVWRTQVAPFSERAADLLTDFATQAAIAVRTVGLVRDLEAGGAALATKVDQLEALAAVGEAVQLQPRPGRGPDHDRHARRGSLGYGRGLDPGVRSGARAVPGPGRLRDQSRGAGVPA